ncbi:MAG TPA: outer membrane beta-barrel protein [Candidatus Eisenbacteria bacterium]
MRLHIAAIALLSLAPAAAFAAQTRGFQLEAEAMGSAPFGTYMSGAKASDLYDPGGNAFGKALFGVSRGVAIGVGVGYLHNQGSLELVVPVSRFATETITAKRSINAIPVLALGQIHSDMHRTLSVYGEGGLGFAHLERRFSEFSPLANGFQIEPVSNFQTGTAFLLGAGLCLGAGRNWEFTLGTGWLQTFTGNGDAFRSGDNPAFLTYSIGARYPRW